MTTAQLSILFSFAVLVATQAAGRPPLHWVDSVTVRFDGRHGQVEVGGPFVGLEFHASRPLPSRISFYSPVANSIDLSTDYWKRGESRPLVMGIRVDRGAKTWLGKEPWEYWIQNPFYWNGNLGFGAENNPYFATHGDIPNYLRRQTRPTWWPGACAPSPPRVPRAWWR